jgi:UDP-GlcNAc:undecaprenyl-phosphate GlcNAc-1-phosphate transferase
MTIIGSGLIAILATLFFIWLFRHLAVKLDLVDRPGGRKLHTSDVPLIGGIAIFFGFCFAILSLPTSLQSYRALIAGSGLLLTMGIVDDFRELSSKLRLVGQVGAALILVCWGGLQITSLGNLLFLGDISLGTFAIPFTVLLVVGFLNATNMVDGQDGLAGGIALGQTILLSYLAWKSGREGDLNILIIMTLLLIVFLVFNMRLPWRSQAAIFLGDAGSTFIAFVIAWFAISIGQGGVVKPVIILWILAFPVFDLFHVCLVRLLEKKSLLDPSLDHLHHILKGVGLEVTLSTSLLSIFSFLLGALVIILDYWQVPEAWQFFLWILMLLSYLYIIELIRTKKIDKKHVESE